MSSKHVPVVFITGKKGSGKDTFARYLKTAMMARLRGGGPEETERPTVRVVGFADPLKEMVSRALGFPLWWCHEPAMKEKATVYGKTVREWLQWFGTEVFRQGVHRDFWCHAMLCRILGDQDTKGWIITDCRFPNEWWLVAGALDLDFSPPPGVVAGDLLASENDVPEECVRASEADDERSFSCRLVLVERPGLEDGVGAQHASERGVDDLRAFAPLIVQNDGPKEALVDMAEVYAAGTIR